MLLLLFGCIACSRGATLNHASLEERALYFRDSSAVFQILDSAFKEFGRREFFLKGSEDELFQHAGTPSTYGYILPQGTLQMLAHFNGSHFALRNATFYDLGSGSGRGVLAAALLEPALRRAVGVELAESRDRIAREAESYLPTYARNTALFLNGNLLDLDISDADLVYVSNLCMDDIMQRALADKLALELDNGAVIFSSKPVPIDPAARTTSAERVHVPMSWNADHSAYVLTMGPPPNQ